MLQQVKLILLYDCTKSEKYLRQHWTIIFFWARRFWIFPFEANWVRGSRGWLWGGTGAGRWCCCGGGVTSWRRCVGSGENTDSPKLLLFGFRSNNRSFHRHRFSATNDVILYLILARCQQKNFRFSCPTVTLFTTGFIYSLKISAKCPNMENTFSVKSKIQSHDCDCMHNFRICAKICRTF